jgi:hypothetical protein
VKIQGEKGADFVKILLFVRKINQGFVQKFLGFVEKSQGFF